MTLLTIDLRAEARAEAARLGAARALVRQPDPGGPGDDIALAHLEADGAWITIARSPALRAALAGRALLIWRVAFEDANGRLVDSQLVAIAVTLSRAGSRLRRRKHIDALVRAIERETLATVERCTEAWGIEVERTTRAFTATRASRAGAIDDADAAGGIRLIQPGLFDRRALRAAHPAAQGRDTTAPAAAAAGGMVRPRLRLVVVP